MKNLTRMIFVLTFFAMTSSLMAYDVKITEDELPENAKAFLKKYFPNDNVVYAEKDFDSYDVSLQSGIEIDFDKNGNWYKVAGRGMNTIPTDFIPKSVMKTVTKAYSGAKIIDIEYKDTRKYYEIKLDNRMELKIDINGKMLKQEYDD